MSSSSFLYAEGEGPREIKRAHYLATAVYVYAYLFPAAGPAPAAFDPRFRDHARRFV